ncbi:MAG: hypothetical protein QOK35_1749, partial [Pseudonocardiales bacterium]|nr:hypothetical protein [Pseudonocardiales bacterium]
MTPRRWTFAHVVALVELACGVVAAVWLFGVGIAAAGTGGRSVLDRSFPFLVGAAVGLGLAVQAVRTWRAAEREAREAAGRQASASSSAAPGSRPSLSAEGQRELDRVVALLAAAGVFAPRAPEPVELSEAVADAGEPVLAEAVLMAVEEAAFYRPDFRASEHSANLAFHDSHTEQFAEVLQAQAEDVVRLSGGGLAGVSTAVEIGANGRVPVRLRISVDGDERV